VTGRSSTMKNGMAVPPYLLNMQKRQGESPASLTGCQTA
jgi:hypothetical protein